MTKSKTLASAAAVAGLGLASLLIAAPAAAAPYTGDDIVIGDYTWDLNTDYLEINDTQYYNETTSVDLVDAWDDSEFAVWDDVAETGTQNVLCLTADIADADLNGDIVVSCADELLEIGLTASAEIRLYGEGDLARLLVTLSNETDAAIDYSWQYYVNYGSTSYRATSGTPELGETAYVDSDLWSFNDQSDGFDAGVAWGMADAGGAHERVTDDGDTDGLYVWSDADDGTQNTLAVDESVTYVFFQKVDASETIDFAPGSAPATDAALTPADVSASPAAFMAEFTSLEGRLARGIDPTAVVANWMPASETPASPELAETGASALTLGLGFAGALALALGLALMAVRAMRTRSTSAV